MHNLKRTLPFLTLILLALLLAVAFRPASSTSQAASLLPTPVAPEPYPYSNRYPAVVYLASEQDLQTLYRLQIDFEGLRLADGSYPVAGGAFQPAIATVYITPAESDLLAQQGLTAIPIANEGLRSFYQYGPGSGAPDAWPTYDQFVTRMQNLKNDHHDLVDLVSIGQSVLGRDIWCLEVTDNPGVDENEPEFKYTANMHGDETVGIEISLRLAELLVANYGIDPNLTALVNGIETWVCPIHNPDGYVAGTRYNAHGQDLNRDFPDRFMDPVDDPAGHEPETQAFMVFGYAHRFVMGANYHGGAQVVNYPWDAVVPEGDPVVPAYAPDDSLFNDFSNGYAVLNPDIDWITRGWQWYQIWGGMQDWAYYWHGEHHVTIEVSNDKMPPYNQMDIYWNNNKDAMLWWMERTLTGLHGRVLDARDSAPLDASVTIAGMEQPNTILTDPDVGDYHRVIAAGNYNLTAEASGYLSQTYSVSVVDGAATIQDFSLCPSDPWTVSGVVTDSVTGQPLAASIELLGSPLATATNPGSGFYSLDVCPYTYTMRASAPLHYPQERPVVVDHSQTQNFALEPMSTPPDLTPSHKLAEAEQVAPGAVVNYDLVVQNNGRLASAALTDTLPLSVTWSGYLTATQGTPLYSGGQIIWQSEISQGQSVTITYGVTLGQCLVSGAQLTNVAVLNDHAGTVLTRTAMITVTNLPPSIPILDTPVDGAQDQPRDMTLVWQASSDPNCDPLTYDLSLGVVTPPPLYAAGLTSTSYSAVNLAPHTTYYWSVRAEDGITYTDSVVWQFTTLNLPPDPPDSPSPADAAIEVSTGLTLTWQDSDPDGDLLTYTLEFGTTPTPTVVAADLTSPLYYPGPLQPGTTYYWRITANDGLTQTVGELWSFTTQPLRFYLPLVERNSSVTAVRRSTATTPSSGFRVPLHTPQGSGWKLALHHLPDAAHRSRLASW